MKVLIGLGNPGKKYKDSRHNLGFLVVDKIAKENKVTLSKKECLCLLAEGKIAGQRIILAKPQTYMNSSGEAVKSVVTKYKLELKDILVICDDVNLPESVLRIRPSGSAGGHKGLRSIIHTLKSEEFPRLRIGVDTKRTKKRDLTSFVLEPINKRSKQTIEKSIDSVVSCCYIWLKEGVIASMNKCNAKDKE